MSDVSQRPSVLQLIPPPLLFAVPLIVGIFLERRFPLLDSRAGLAQASNWAGIALIALGAMHALWALGLFALRRTTLAPHHVSVSLVTTGVYRWTRNPMYVGLVLIYLGVSLLTSAVWAVLLLPLPVIAVNTAIIPLEERLLDTAFGPAYAQYKARVRRWI